MSEIIFTAKEVESLMQECAFKSVAKVLDMISTEIEEIETYDGLYIDRAYVLQIIDKYRTESEERE